MAPGCKHQEFLSMIPGCKARMFDLLEELHHFKEKCYADSITWVEFRDHFVKGLGLRSTVTVPLLLQLIDKIEKQRKYDVIYCVGWDDLYGGDSHFRR